MSNITSINEQELATRAEQFKQFYGILYRTEIAISNRALQAVGGISFPETKEQLPEAEAALKSLQAVKTEIQAERKTITTKLDGLVSRLMQPEKSLEEPVKQLESAIIKVKKVIEAEEATKRAKEEERKRMIETIKNAAAQAESNFKTIILNKVNAAYIKALEDNIQVQSIDKYIDDVCNTITDSSFPLPKFNKAALYFSAEEVDALVSEHFNLDRSDYVALFAIELTNKFSDYEVAINNKEEAAKIAEQERLEEAAKIEAATQNAKMANKLESVAAAMPETPNLFTKALKKSYEVDMSEDVQSALVIMAAFSANLDLCLPKLKINKWFSFTPTQAANALAKVKCDDNNFAPTGIIFKEIDKL